MPTTALPAVQDARLRPLKLASAHTVLFAIYGDSNAVGVDAATTDWSPRLLAGEYPTNGMPTDCEVWDKWGLGPGGTRNTDVADGAGWRPCDGGIFDHGGAVYRGLGQTTRSNGPETAAGHFLRTHLVRDGQKAGGAAPTLKLRFAKYAIAGSVVHDSPANPSAGWHPTGTGTAAFNLITTRYLRPAVTNILAAATATQTLYFGGSLVVCPGTDAIDTGGVFTEPGDAEAYGGNLQAVIQGVHDFMGCPRAPTVLGIPPFVQENAASNLGYPNLEMIQRLTRELAARREAAGFRTIAIDLEGIERIADGLHYSNWGQWIVGRRMAQAMIRNGILLHRVTAAP